MIIPIHEIIFFFFALIAIISALCVILLKNPVRAALTLVLTFFCFSVLWMMLQAEFLSLALIFVYVGAVMTLFLFVVMMLNPKTAEHNEGYLKYMPLGVIVLALFAGLVLYVIGPTHLHDAGMHLHQQPKNFSDVTEMGVLLFTQYIYPFEIAGLILLAAIIGAISLAFFGRKPGNKAQNAAKQLAAKKSERLRIIGLEGDDA